MEESDLTEELQYTCRTLTKQDEPAVIKLVNDAFQINSKSWVWKYKSNPQFDPSLYVVIERGGKVIGCCSAIPRDLKISNSLTVKAVLGADFVIHPDHRSSGAGTALLRFSRDLQKSKGAIMLYAFPTPKAGKHLYKPIGKSIEMPGSRTVYTRLLNCQRLKEKALSINSLIESNPRLAARLSKLEISVLFRLIGAPTFLVKINYNGIAVEERKLNNPDMIVKGEWPILASVIDGEISRRNLVKVLFTRKIKIKGSLRNVFKLYEILKILKLTLSQK